MKPSSGCALSATFAFALAIPMFAIGAAQAAPQGGSVGHAPAFSATSRSVHHVAPIRSIRVDRRAGRFRGFFVAGGGYAAYPSPDSFYGPIVSQHFTSAPSITRTMTIVHVADDAPARPVGPPPCTGPKIIELGGSSKSRAAPLRVIRGGGDVSCSVGNASGEPGIYSVN